MKIQWESLRAFLKLLCVTLSCQCLFKKDFSLCLCQFFQVEYVVALIISNINVLLLLLFSLFLCNVFEKAMWSRVTQWLGLSKTYMEVLVSVDALVCTHGSSCLGPKPAFWVMSWAWVSRKLTLGWRLVCRKLARECFGGHHRWKGGKGSSFG